MRRGNAGKREGGGSGTLLGFKIGRIREANAEWKS